jgi:thiol:disulfide interchange protein
MTNPTSTPTPTTRTLHSLEGFEDWDTMLTQVRAASGDKHSVIVVSATWCGPCTALKASILNRTKLPDVEFDQALWFILDVDDNSESLHRELNVTKVPRVLFVDVNGNTEVMAANPLAGVRKRLGQSYTSTR